MQKSVTLSMLAILGGLHAGWLQHDADGQEDVESAVTRPNDALDTFTPQDILSQAQIAAAKRNHQDAIRLLSNLIDRPSTPASAYYLRGRARLCHGDFAGAVADFDAYIQQQPSAAAQLWERGIACYYAGQYDAGARQFTSYQAFDGNDVENAVWHIMCRAPIEGFDMASARIMNVRRDTRIPMREVFELFAGRGTVQAVLERAEREPEEDGRRHRSLFYAHLYLGLYHEARQDGRQALQHLNLATHKYPIDNYMWDVAKIHLETRQAEASGKAPSGRQPAR